MGLKLACFILLATKKPYGSNETRKMRESLPETIQGIPKTKSRSSNVNAASGLTGCFNTGANFES